MEGFGHRKEGKALWKEEWHKQDKSAEVKKSLQA